MKRDPFILGPTGTPFRCVGGNVFEKDVLVEGEYQHPIQPWDEPLRATRGYIETVCRNTNAAMAAGQRVYVPDGHSTKAKDNTGFSTEFVPRLEDGKWRAKARIKIEDPEYVSKIGTTIRDVSPMIVNYPLGDGQDFGERIAHVALVPDPVMPGQGDFVACSMSPGTIETVEVPVLKPVPLEPAAMKIKVTDANVKMLSLSGTAVKVGDEVEAEVVEKALSASVAATDAAQKAQKAAEDALAAEKAKPAATPERLLSIDAKATPYFGEARRLKTKNLASTLDLAQAKGKINAKMRGVFEKILSVSHGYALSEMGAAAVVDVEALAESLLAEIPEQAAVPVGERIIKEGGTGADGRPANEPEKFDAAGAADRALELAGFKKPKDATPKK